MIKRVLLLLIILVASIYIGLEIRNDPGYLLLNYKQWTIEMPLWFAGIGLLLVFGLIYSVLRFVSFLGSISGRFARWRRRHKEKSAHDLTTQGLIDFTEGNWVQAEKHLTRAVDIGENPLINYLAAARAAQEQGATHRRDKYLRKAQKSRPDAKLAVELSQAQLQIASGQFEQALATLRHLQSLAPNHQYVLKLLQQLYVKCQDWEALVALLPQLRKRHVLSDIELTELEMLGYRGVLETGSSLKDLAFLKSLWQGFPSKIRKRNAIIAVYVQCLLDHQDHQEAESLLYYTLKKNWDDELIRFYGLCKTEEPAKQLSKAEGWLKQHPNNAFLLLTLGRLCVDNQLWGKARTYFENSLAHYAQPEVYAELAKLLDQLGETELAAKYYREGLRYSLVASDKPVLTHERDL